MHKEVMEVVAYLRGSDADPILAANALEQILRQAPPPVVLKSLTRKQRHVFDFVRSHIASSGYAPTLDDIREHFGLRSLSAPAEHVAHLEAKGWITKKFNRSGTLEITSEATNA